MKFIDSCKTLEILKQDSGLLPKPYESWNTFTPKKGDYAFVMEENAVYEFTGKRWTLRDKINVDDDCLLGDK